MMPFNVRRTMPWLLITGMLAALGISLLLSRRGREAGVGATQCRQNMLQISLGLANYIALNNSFPPGAVPNPGEALSRRWSWISAFFGYLDANGPRIPDISRAWDDPYNRRLLEYDEESGKEHPIYSDVTDVFRCPSFPRRTNPAGYGLTTYIGVGGLGKDAPWQSPRHPRRGIFGFREATKISQVSDGLSNTMAVIESSMSNGPWRAAGYSTVRGLEPHQQPYLGKGLQFGGLHANRTMVLYADGSVRFIRDSVDRRVFEAQATIAGNEQTERGKEDRAKQ